MKNWIYTLSFSALYILGAVYAPVAAGVFWIGLGGLSIVGLLAEPEVMSNYSTREFTLGVFTTVANAAAITIGLLVSDHQVFAGFTALIGFCFIVLAYHTWSES